MIKWMIDRVTVLFSTVSSVISPKSPEKAEKPDTEAHSDHSALDWDTDDMNVQDWE
jgi:hypothetical protein